MKLWVISRRIREFDNGNWEWELDGVFTSLQGARAVAIDDGMTEIVELDADTDYREVFDFTVLPVRETEGMAA